MSVEETLEQRGSRYGNYKNYTIARVKIMKVLTDYNENEAIEKMTPEMETAIGDLVMKLVRVAACPSYKDSIHDIQGYAKLIEDEL